MQRIDQHTALLSIMRSLNTDQPLLDDRTEVDHLRFLVDFAELLNFYDTNNEIKGNWSPLLLKDPTFLLASIARTPYQQMAKQFDSTCLSLERVIPTSDPKLSEQEKQEILKTGLQQLFDICFSVFTLFVKWTYYMQRYPKEYLLKKYMIQQVTDTYGPLLWALLQFRNSLYQSHQIDMPKIVRPYEFESTEQYCWLVNKGRKPYWVILNRIIDHIGPINGRLNGPKEDIEGSADSSSTKNSLQGVYSALSAATADVLTFLKQVVLYAHQDFNQLNEGRQSHADTGLLRAFVHLLDYYKQKLNSLSKTHLNYYYQDILKQDTVGYGADQVFVNMTLAGTQPYLLPAMTSFLGGTYADGSPVLFKSLTNTVLNPAKLSGVYTLYRQRGEHLTSLHLTEVQKVTTVHQAPGGVVQGWDTFGSAQGVQQKGAFIMASPMLLLQEGTRTITLTLGFKQNVSSAFLNQLQYSLSTAKGWYDVIQPTTSTGGEPCSDKNASGYQCKIVIKLDPTAPPIVRLPETSPFFSQWPSLKISFDQLNAESQPVFECITIDVFVEDVRELVLQNDYGALESSKPFMPLGPVPEEYSSFYIGSSEIFSKPFYCLTLNCDWDKLPLNFYSYYIEYSALLLWEQYQQTHTLCESVTNLLFFNNVFKVTFSMGQPGNSWSALQMKNVRWDDVYPSGTINPYPYKPQCLFTEAYDQGQGPAAYCKEMKPPSSTQSSDDAAYTVTYDIWEKVHKAYSIYAIIEEVLADLSKQFLGLHHIITVRMPDLQKAANSSLKSHVQAVRLLAKSVQQLEEGSFSRIDEVIKKLGSFRKKFTVLMKRIKSDLGESPVFEVLDNFNEFSSKLASINTALDADHKLYMPVSTYQTLKELQILVTTFSDLIEKHPDWIQEQHLELSLTHIHEMLKRLEKRLKSDFPGKNTLKTLLGIIAEFFADRQVRSGVDGLDVSQKKAAISEFKRHVATLATVIENLEAVVQTLFNCFPINIVSEPSSDTSINKFNCFYQLLQELEQGFPWLFHNLRPETIFNYINTDSQSSDNTPCPYDPNLQLSPLTFSENSTSGFLQMQLISPHKGFASSIFAQVVSSIALYNGFQLIGSKADPTTTVMTPPPDPFTPSLKSISASYRASCTYDLSTLDDPKISGKYPLECFYETPFGKYKVYDNTIKDGFYSGGTVLGIPEVTPIRQELPLYPVCGTTGTLFVPLTEAVVPAELSLYAELAPKAIEGKIQRSALQFTYLSETGWKPLTIQSDTTHSFMCSGILSFNFPEDAVTNSTLMPDGFHWICIGTSQAAHQMPQTTYLNTNGVLLERDLSTTPVEFNPTLSASKVTKTDQPMPEIADVAQPFASFGGRVKETFASRNLRISNRIGNKNRVLSHSDYYRVALQRFPGLYYCQSDYFRTHQSLVLYCAAKRADASEVNSFLPVVTDCELRAIESYLRKKASGLYEINAENFVPSFIQLHCRVVPRDTSVQNLLPQQIDEAYKLYLSPWIKNNSDARVIGKTVTVEEIAQVIMGVPNVAEIQLLELIQLKQDAPKHHQEELSTTSQPIQFDASMLLVPSMFNHICIGNGA